MVRIEDEYLSNGNVYKTHNYTVWDVYVCNKKPLLPIGHFTTKLLFNKTNNTYAQESATRVLQRQLLVNSK